MVRPAILAVDDDPEVLRALGTLRGLGHRIARVEETEPGQVEVRW